MAINYYLLSPSDIVETPYIYVPTENKWKTVRYRPNALVVIEFYEPPPLSNEPITKRAVIFEWDSVDTFDSSEYKKIIKKTQLSVTDEATAAFVNKGPLLRPDLSDLWYFRARVSTTGNASDPTAWTSQTCEIRYLEPTMHRQAFYIYDNIGAGQPKPRIHRVRPLMAWDDSEVRIIGKGFGNTPADYNASIEIWETEDHLGYNYPVPAGDVVSWSDTKIVFNVPPNSGIKSGWVFIIVSSGLIDGNYSNGRYVRMLGSKSDVDTGWFVKTADQNNNLTEGRSIIPANVSSAAFMRTMNAVGSGQIEIPLSDPDLVEMIDPILRNGSFIRCYVDGKMRYGFFAEQVSYDYTDPGDGTATISGRGIEAIAEWSKVLPQDYPNSPSDYQQWQYGSNDNLIKNGGFEDTKESPILVNGDGEEGNDEDKKAVGWKPRGKGLTSYEAIQDPDLSLEGDWVLAVTTSSHHSGIEQTVQVEPNRVYEVEAWVQTPTASGMRITLALGGADDISGTGKYTTKKFNDEILAELDGVPSGSGGCPGGASNGEWQSLKAEIKTGKKQTSLNIAIQDDYHTSCPGDVHGLFYIDSVEAAGWGLGVKPWMPYESDNHANNSFKLQTTVTKSQSTHGLYLNGVSKNAGISQLVEVEPNSLYIATIWAKGWNPSGDYRFRIQKNDGNDTVITQQTKTPADARWEEYEVTFRTDDVTDQVFVRFFYIGAGNPNPVYIDNVQLYRGKPPRTAGRILMDVLGNMQSTTVNKARFVKLPNMTRTFGGDRDSAGVWWRQTISMDIEPDESLLDVLNRLVALGHEWSITPQDYEQDGEEGFELNVYVARPFEPQGGVGTNHTLDPEGPVLISNDAVTGGRVVKTAFNVNTVVGIGSKGHVVRVSQFPWKDGEMFPEDPASRGYHNGYGVIEEVVKVNSTRPKTVSMFAEARLAEARSSEVILQLDMRRGETMQPFEDFDLGDTIHVDIPGVHSDPPVDDGDGGFARLRPKRVRAIQADLAGEGADVTYTVDLDRVLYEDELSWYAEIAQLQERAPSDNQIRQGMGRIR